MATVYKCDKCKKIIKDHDREKSLTYLSFSCGSDIREQYNLPSGFNLCPGCSPVLAGYLAKYLGRKKTKKRKK